MITILGYIGFLLGPSLIGNLADLVGLRWALLALGVAGIGVVLMSFKFSTRFRQKLDLSCFRLKKTLLARIPHEFHGVFCPFLSILCYNSRLYLKRSNNKYGCFCQGSYSG